MLSAHILIATLRPLYTRDKGLFPRHTATHHFTLTVSFYSWRPEQTRRTALGWKEGADGEPTGGGTAAWGSGERGTRAVGAEESRGRELTPGGGHGNPCSGQQTVRWPPLPQVAVHNAFPVVKILLTFEKEKLITRSMDNNCSLQSTLT